MFKDDKENPSLLFKYKNCLKYSIVFIFIWGHLFTVSRERGRGRNREGQRGREEGGERGKHWCERETLISCLLIRTPTGGWTSKLGMCPDRDLNPQPFGQWDDAPTNWATLAKDRAKVQHFWIIFKPILFWKKKFKKQIEGEILERRRFRKEYPINLSIISIFENGWKYPSFIHYHYENHSSSPKYIMWLHY